MTRERDVWYDPASDEIFVSEPFCAGMLWLNTSWSPGASGGYLRSYHEFPRHSVYLGSL